MSDLTELLGPALDRLAAEDPLKADLVKLRYFVGLTLPEAAAALGLSERTAGRHWAYARAWLRRAVEGSRGKILTILGQLCDRISH